MVGAAVAVALKAHYSGARAEDLTWILAPVALVVQTITGQQFYFDPSDGYVSHTLGIVIAPACAGVNFMITVFCMTCFSRIFKRTGIRASSRWLAGCAAISYAVTILANSARIYFSVILFTHNIHLGWLTPMRVHRITGILIYFFFLCLVYHIIRKNVYYCRFFAKGFAQVFKKGKPFPANNPRAILQNNWLWPLCWYWGISLAVPLLNGAYAKNPAGFVEHSLTVGIMSMGLCAGYVFLNRLYHKKWIMVNEPSDSDHRRRTRHCGNHSIRP